jgi:hypothetical protein
MSHARSLLDATNTVSLGDAESVGAAAQRILEQCFGAGTFDSDLLRTSFTLVGAAFAGEHPDLLACDMPYHDLRHSLDTALLMARLVAGSQGEHRIPSNGLMPEDGLLGVLLGLLHDIGYLRRTSESALCGPQLAPEHESRGVEFAERYLQTTTLADHAAQSSLILATRLTTDLDVLFVGHRGAAVTLGRMLGTADLLSQIADRSYLERCYYHLYPELVLGGCNRVRTSDGEERPLFRDALDLVAKTPNFYDHVVRARLDREFAEVAGHLEVLFSGTDPYAAAVMHNVDRARKVAQGRSDLLGPEPVTTTDNLAAAYHVRGPGAR